MICFFKKSISRRGIGESHGRFKVKRSYPNKERKERNKNPNLKDDVTIIVIDRFYN
jgi:hypothetical protein